MAEALQEALQPGMYVSSAHGKYGAPWLSESLCALIPLQPSPPPCRPSSLPPSHVGPCHCPPTTPSIHSCLPPKPPCAPHSPTPWPPPPPPPTLSPVGVHSAYALGMQACLLLAFTLKCAVMCKPKKASASTNTCSISASRSDRSHQGKSGAGMTGFSWQAHVAALQAAQALVKKLLEPNTEHLSQDCTAVVSGLIPGAPLCCLPKHVKLLAVCMGSYTCNVLPVPRGHQNPEKESRRGGEPTSLARKKREDSQQKGAKVSYNPASCEAWHLPNPKTDPQQ